MTEAHKNFQFLGGVGGGFFGGVSTQKTPSNSNTFVLVRRCALLRGFIEQYFFNQMYAKNIYFTFILFVVVVNIVGTAFHEILMCTKKMTNMRKTLFDGCDF